MEGDLSSQQINLEILNRNLSPWDEEQLTPRKPQAVAPPTSDLERERTFSMLDSMLVTVEDGEVPLVLDPVAGSLVNV